MLPLEPKEAYHALCFLLSGEGEGFNSVPFFV